MSDDATWGGSMPALYDSRLGPALFTPYARDLAARAARRQPRRVLELAAGTGLVTAELVRVLPDAELTATDLNEAMVTWGAQRVPQATWQQADAQALDFADAAFDLVACQFGLMFFPDKPGALAQAARVLAPGGTVLLSVWDDVETSTFPAALVDSLVEVLPDNPPAFVVRVPHGYADTERLRRDAESGGLQVQEIERVVLTSRAPSARALAEGFCLGTPLRFELQARGALEELTDAIADAMTARLGAGAVEGELAAFVVTAVHR